MTILSELQGPADLRGLDAAAARAAGRRDPRDDHLHGRHDRRPPRLVARRRRGHARAPPAARVAARPDRLGHRPPGLPAQAAHRPPRAVRDAPPARRDRRLPAPERVARTTSSTAVTPARACRSPRAWPTARDLRHGLERIAVVVGDAALMSGLSLEALNDIGHRGTQLLIVLNDNEMSISPTVGAFSKYLSQIKLSPAWQQSRTAYDRAIERLPVVGGTALELSRRFRKSVVNFAQPGQLFEDLGITYIGVVPGHDLQALERTFAQRARAARAGHRPRPDPEGPRLPPGRDRPGRLPRCRPAADDRQVPRRRRTARTAPPGGRDARPGRRAWPTTRRRPRPRRMRRASRRTTPPTSAPS